MKLFLALVLSLFMSQTVKAEFNSETGLYWMPTQSEVDSAWKVIKKQDKAFNVAYSHAKETGESEDYNKAEVLALFPVQKAWLHANRGWFLKDSAEDLESAKAEFEAAIGWAKQEEKRIAGPTGSKVCIGSCQASIDKIDEKLSESEK